MSSTVSWILDLDIKEGRNADFAALMQEMVTATEAGEPGALNYEWVSTADGAKCQIYERYVDSAATMVHLGNFGEKFAARFMDIMTPTRFVVYGSPDAAVREALAPLGAVYMERAAGFTR